MEEIKYSIVMLVNNTGNLDNALESISKQKYDKKKIEVIVVDNSDDKKVKKIIDDYDIMLNIKYISNHNKDYIELLNDAIKESKGTTITFIDDQNYYKDNKLFSNLEYLTNKYDLVSIKSEYYDSDNNKFVDYKMMPGASMKIELEDNPYNLSLNLNSYFISADLIKDIKFNSLFNDEYKIVFLINLLEKCSMYYFLKNSVIVTNEPFETNTSKNSIQYNKWWYTESINKLTDYFSKYESIPVYIQEIIVYIVYTKINCNIYDRNKGVLTKEESLEFFASLDKLISLVDKNLLLRDLKDGLHIFNMQRWVRYLLLERQMPGKRNISVKDNKIYIDVNSSKISDFDIECEQVNVFAINYKKGKLYFDCSTSLSDLLKDNEFEIYIKYGDKKVSVERSYFYPLLKIFGKTYSEKYCFKFSVDISEVKSDIKVYAFINGNEVPLIFNYSKVQARLCNSKRSFWHYKDFVLYNKVDHIEVKKASRGKLILSEILFDFSKLKNCNNKFRILKLIFLRMLYYITRPYYKNKHVWLTWDKLYKAGDNGEYMYQYCMKQKRNIYYIVKKDSPDYERLHKQNRKRCVVFNSLKAKLLSLHSEAILDTHANVISYCGFDGISRHLVCGLFNPEIICIQHGLTIQKIAQYQNRLFDNIKYYCCASQYEIDNIKQPMYDYSENQMSLTGLARYDGLKSKEEKIILITPTWRRNVVNSSVAYIKKKHNDNFKNSDYFSIYNSLINNNKLIECAKKNGYKIIYLLHPAMSGQLEDFTRNDYVEIIPATGNVNYEDILTRSALMVTDYSGVQFDFAYQRKVLIYYHPDALPPHYDDGGLEYETMGFGPICKNEEQIVNELCDNMNNGCKIASKYKQRADKFFAYDDFNNCKRILDKIDEYFQEINE